jgi:hypothetical protein
MISVFVRTVHVQRVFHINMQYCSPSTCLLCTWSFMLATIVNFCLHSLGVVFDHGMSAAGANEKSRITIITKSDSDSTDGPVDYSKLLLLNAKKCI